jgi:hypothetical protein
MAFIIDDVELTKKWLNSPELERLDDARKLGSKVCPYFEASALSGENGKHFPLVNEPDEYIISGIVDEIRLTLSEITEKDYQKISDLVRQGVSNDELLVEFAKISGNKFGRCIIDKDFLTDARKLPSLGEMFNCTNPLEEIVSAKQRIVEKVGNDYIKIHNAIASTLLCPILIRKTLLEPNKSIEQIVYENAPLKHSLRVVKNQVIIGGKVLPKNSVVLFNVALCAKTTQDTRFVFGQGNNVRHCPFSLFMFPFLTTLRLNEASRKYL